jgi:hypothetical protein
MPSEIDPAVAGERTGFRTWALVVGYLYGSVTLCVAAMALLDGGRAAVDLGLRRIQRGRDARTNAGRVREFRLLKYRSGGARH